MSTAFGDRHPWLGNLARRVTKNAFTVVFGSQIVTMACLPLAIYFMDNTATTSDPLHDTKSWHARNTMLKLFPADTDTTTFITVIALKDKYVDKLNYSYDTAPSANLLAVENENDEQYECSYSNVTCTHKMIWQRGSGPPLLNDVKHALEKTKDTYRSRERVDAKYAPILNLPGLVNFSFALNQSINNHRKIVSFISNATLWYGLGLPAPRGIVNPEGTATKLIWTLGDSPTDEKSIDASVGYKNAVENKVKQYLPENMINYGLFSAANTCHTSFLDSERAFLIMDLTSAPLSGLVFLYVLGSYRLLIFPMMCLGTAMVLSFAIMDIVAISGTVMCTVPSLMMNIGIAMSTDYALFFLTRFRREMEISDEEDVHLRVQQSIIIAMETAGFAIFMSGGTLFCAFLMLCLMPLPAMSSVGWGCSVTLVLLVFTNLTLGPAILMHKAEMVALGITRKPAAERAEQENSITKFWRGAVRFQLNPLHGALTVIAVTGFTLFVGWPFMNLHLHNELDPLIPLNTDAHDAYVLLKKEFGAGQFGPTQIVMSLQAGNATSVLDQGPFEDSRRLLETMVTNLPYTEGVVIESPAYNIFEDGVPRVTPYETVTRCMGEFQTFGIVFQEDCFDLLRTTGMYVSADRQGMWASLSLAIDPASHEGQRFTKRARDLVEKFQQGSQLRIQLTGPGPETTDMIDEVIDTFPIMVAGTFGCCFVLYGYFFRSIVIPVRSVLSIALTLIWCFGLGVRVYQQSFLQWLSYAPLRTRSSGLGFVLPSECFTIVVGLCLDYDIFLLSRVTELRAEGMPTSKAIEEGVVSTGSIITAAGMIMFLSFSGMIASTTMQVLNTMGFFMATAVLYDTFIIRTTVVPAVMMIVDRFEWWPGELSYKMPCDQAGAVSEGSQRG